MRRRACVLALLPSWALPVAAAPATGLHAGPAAATAPAERVRLALKEMQLVHEAVPAGVADGVGWKTRPAEGMGTEPYASSIKPWWKGTRFAQWRSIVSWFTIYAEEGSNLAPNSAVEIAGIEAWYLSATDGVWKRLQSSRLPIWHGAYATNAIDRSQDRIHAAPGAEGLVLAPSGLNMVHGGLGHADTPWTSDPQEADLAAVLVSVRHRLVLKDVTRPDDAADAHLIVQAGADYYPFKGAKVGDMAAAYVPSIGLGRFVRASTQWRYALMVVTKKGLPESQLLRGLPAAFDF